MTQTTLGPMALACVFNWTNSQIKPRELFIFFNLKTGKLVAFRQSDFSCRVHQNLRGVSFKGSPVSDVHNIRANVLGLDAKTPLQIV